jgi:hypothetical protein
MLDPLHRVFNLRVDQFNGTNRFQQAQQVFAPMFFGLVGSGATSKVSISSFASSFRSSGLSAFA